MENEVKFYRCKHCGKIVVLVKDTKVPTMCCGEAMEVITPSSTDAAVEKHVPLIALNGNIATVTIGEVVHPMLSEHFIEWIVLVTDKGIQKKTLTPGSEPKTSFALLDGEKVLSAFAYCNLHSLWMSK